MVEIAVLSKETIDQIAAGEVVERPASVVKELVENAMDAGADAITVEIRDGGTSFIRVTDNGCGIPKEQLRLAFTRHATSKIRSAQDLAGVRSLGFRGEALSSIGAVAKVEMITKPKEQWMGCRYVIEDSQETAAEDVGSPDGTTIMVHQLFWHLPARRKFLKSNQTEGNHIAELVERLALSHPEISFCLISNKAEKLHTSGSGSLLDAVYQVYGRDIAANLLPVSSGDGKFRVEGFLGNSTIARGSRSLETFFVDGRYVRSPLLSRALEEGYLGYLMQHQYPFCVLQIVTEGVAVDVNVHPTKQEVRFEDEIAVARFLTELVRERLHRREDIARIEAPPPKEEPSPLQTIPMVVEPFEEKKLSDIRAKIADEIRSDTPYRQQYEQRSFLDRKTMDAHRLIGQVFGTYWMVEYDSQLYIIDQHAAHEKVLYERTMAALADKQMTSQMISPPLIVTLTKAEQGLLETYGSAFTRLGYSVSPFGGNEFAITAVPDNMFSLDVRRMFMDLLASCAQETMPKDESLVMEKVASLSCKAAVKGNHRLSEAEIRALIDELLTLDNPYHCPHGRPTMIAVTKEELEKRFKRIVS